MAGNWQRKYGDSARQRTQHDDLPAASNESSKGEVWLAQIVGCLRKLTKKFGGLSSDGVLLRARARNTRSRAKQKRQREDDRNSLRFASLHLTLSKGSSF
jgi:hypothetical protein